ncbi:ABC transporter ATP-binding protein [Paenibacillus glufosinatiresistens]|uniref:ABC transporter ATP-binding protein n=1 Tax=Paenibacillus glufosinatiresistens TaxID=3070657 RepID=UPI00286E60FA|nr:ABC transporter ATP-binding protein [Paenibacillus sp. YX.27]
MNGLFVKKDLGLLKRCLAYLTAYKIKVTATFLCIGASLALQIVQPWLIGKAIGFLFTKNLNQLGHMLIYLFVVELGVASLSFLQSYLFSSLSEYIIYDLKNDMFQKIIELPVKLFDRMKVGELISRLQGDTAIVADILTNQFINTVIDILKVLIMSFAVFRISPLLSLIVIASFPLTLFIFTYSGKKVRLQSQELAKCNDHYFGNLQQSIAGVKEIKSLGIIPNTLYQFRRLGLNLRTKNITINVISTMARSLSQVISFVSQIAIIALAGYLIAKGKLQIPYFIAFLSYSGQLTSSLMNLTQVSSTFQRAMTSLERIFDLLDDFGMQKERFGPINSPIEKGAIAFRNVSFGYEDQRKILHHLNFSIPSNSITAIVGSSGSGKSTLMNLLLHFYGVDEGEIQVDGVNLNDYSEAVVRRHISIVHQSPYLFNSSFSENMRVANADATEEEMIAICQKINIHNYITNLPDGYNTIIEENGANLSGGQRQRVAIARAMLKKSKIILFDEATSALDNETQQSVKDLIQQIASNHTVVVIAHRLSSIIDADQILVIEAGRLVGQGTHRSLLGENATYRKLYEHELEYSAELIS